MAFDAFDHDKKGSISTSMVNTILGMLGHEVPSEQLAEIIAEIDTWGTGELKFEEFCQLASRFLEEDTDTEAIQHELREAFRLYDKEGNGYITTEVFRDILHELDDALSPEELDMIIEEVDTDGSGTLDYDGEILRDAQEDLNKDQIALLKKAFDAFDQQKKGSIGTNMVGTILTMLGHELSENTLQEIISEVDEDGSGELEFEEFCTLAARFLVEEDTEAMQQELREAFRLYDKEGNGYITTAVFRDILHELDDKLSPEELDLMIEEIDADGSGTLDFDAKSIERSISLSPWVVRQVCSPRENCAIGNARQREEMLRLSAIYMQGVRVCEHVLSYYVYPYLLQAYLRLTKQYNICLDVFLPQDVFLVVRAEPRRDLLGDSIQPCVIDVISSPGVTVAQLARAPNVYPEMSDNVKLKSLYFLWIFAHSYRLTTSLRGKICVRKIGKAIEAYRAAPLDSVHHTGSRDTRGNLHRSARSLTIGFLATRAHRHTCLVMTNPFDTLEPTDKRGEFPRCTNDSSSMLNKI
ncbi:Troponin C, isoform 1 [Trachymyrmex zeteki]|uniref:Troponin C, isoform 1 n=1 Tax=Mycetomoellerius zeteki TaxID=64791 RepID=A0A151X7D1_9HYME|nr:Troponin C, isoform 1 [Trachymyrmex zeteki]